MATPVPEARLLRTSEVAALLQVSPRTIRNMLRDGRLRPVRFGRAVRFNPASVKSAIEKLEASHA